MNGDPNQRVLHVAEQVLFRLARSNNKTRCHQRSLTLWLCAVTPNDGGGTEVAGDVNNEVADEVADTILVLIVDIGNPKETVKMFVSGSYPDGAGSNSRSRAML